MLALWILLGIAALLALLLFLPLRIELHVREDGVFSYRVRYLFLTLTDSETPKKQPAAPRKKAEKKATGSSAGPLLSLLGLQDLTSAAAVKKAIAEKGLVEFLRAVAAAVKRFLGRTARFLRKGVFRKFDLRIVIADEDAADAALQYGETCAVVYPLLTLLSERMRLRQRKVLLRCDYDAAQSSFRFDGQLSFRLWHIASYLIFLFANYLKKERR